MEFPLPTETHFYIFIQTSQNNKCLTSLQVLKTLVILSLYNVNYYLKFPIRSIFSLFYIIAKVVAFNLNIQEEKAGGSL